MYQKLDDKVPTEPQHAMTSLVPEALGHLTGSDIKFFDNWSKMNSLESGEARKGSKLKNLWCMTPGQRELQGQAISNLILAEGQQDNLVAFKKVNGQTFGASVSIFQTGDMVIVSSVQGELALAQGTVSRIDEKTIHLKLDKKIDDQGLNSAFVIDKFEYALSSGNWLTLAKLMSNSDQAKMLREIVISKKAAKFVSGLPKQVALMGKSILKPLNRVQQKAIFKTMMAEEFVLVKGMPGSGKTTMIVALVRLLVKMGKNVLLTSYTHSAVDNLLIKLLRDGEPCFLRLGKKSKIHDDLKEHSEDYLIDAKNINTPEELSKLYRSQPVIATTCLGANNHPCLQQRQFDYCILDEAGKLYEL